ncbi:MAG TPA: YceI family protein [Burkholderiaceae bacterium]
MKDEDYYMINQGLKRFVTLSIAAVCISCSSGTTPPPAMKTDARNEGQNALLDEQYDALAKNGAKVIRINPSKSTVRIYAFRGGRASRLGHNHVISAPEFTGFFAMQDSPNDARFDLEFRLDKLEIDNPEYRAPLGKAFATTVSPDAIAGTRDHMLGENNMQAAAYPLVQIHSLHITGESPKFAVDARIDIHGQSREMWIPLTVEGLPEHLDATGALVIRQTDFGIKPYSVMNGLLSVQDEVVVDFHLVSD